jgi:hypothetical protein
VADGAGGDTDDGGDLRSAEAGGHTELTGPAGLGRFAGEGEAVQVLSVHLVHHADGSIPNTVGRAPSPYTLSSRCYIILQVVERPIALTTETEPGSAALPVGDKLALPERWTVTVDDPRWPVCRLAIEVGDDLRPACRTLTCEPRPGEPPVTGETLRRLPVGAFVRESVRAVAWVRPAPAYELNAEPGGYAITGSPSALEVERPKRGKPVPDATLREVANVYRDAQTLGQAPTQAVAARIAIPRSTAGRWVMQARRRGFLPAATRGQEER